MPRIRIIDSVIFFHDHYYYFLNRVIPTSWSLYYRNGLSKVISITFSLHKNHSNKIT